MAGINNKLMQEHSTFSLSTILNTHQLQPQVYHHMIHQIKSPLQEQSFDYTNDNSRSFERVPQRPMIPPAPSRSPQRTWKDAFSRTYDSMSVDLARSVNRQQPNAVDEAVLSVVSPLQYEVNIRKEQAKGPAVWCGGHLDRVLRVQDVQAEVQVPFRSSSNYRRKPIFNKGQALTPKQSRQQPTRQSPTRLSRPVEPVADQLRQEGEPQLAAFLELMGLLEKQFRQVDEERPQMESNLSKIYEKLSAETSYATQVSERNDTQARILKRLHARNTGQAVRKILGRDKRRQQQGQQRLQKLFTRLSNIELIITDYINRDKSLEHMSAVYDKISSRHSEKPSLMAQLRQWYHSLGLNLQTKGLQLIWEGSLGRRLSKGQFIEGLSLNAYIVREEKGFEEDLLMKGFHRNVD